MPVLKAVVASPLGLHARPAADFVRAVNGTGFAVTIAKAGAPAVDARSLLQVMAADFNHACEVELRISDAGPTATGAPAAAQKALQDLAGLLSAQGSSTSTVSARQAS